MPYFYTIKPIGNGCVSLGKDTNDNYVEILKSDSNYENKLLIFSSEAETQEYINKNLDPTKYIPEWVFRTDKFVCPKCGSALKIQMVVEAEKSTSGHTERIGSCRNECCMADWNIITDNEDNIIKTERFFCG